MIRESIISIQKNKGVARIWLEGKYLQKAGFNQGCNIKIILSVNQITISLDETGDRIVSKHKELPVIDINNNYITKIFNISEKVKAITSFGKILITRTKRQLKKLLALKDRSCGSLFSGGGLLDEAAKRAGFKTKWGIEINKDFADIWQQNHEGLMYNADISEIDYNELEPVELLIAGIPCEPFTKLTKNKIEYRAMHDNADLSMFFLMVVEAVNPRTIVLEEVPGYIKSSIGINTIAALERMGYNVNHKLVCGNDAGELSIRKRLIVIASLDSNPSFPVLKTRQRKMNEILLPYDHPECKWFDQSTKSWIFESWKKTKEKGRNFLPQIITQESDYIQAIPKRYFEQQPGNPIVKHPFKEDTYRWLTITEIKRIMGLQDDYILSDAKTTSGKVLGQGILVNLFTKIIQGVVTS